MWTKGRQDSGYLKLKLFSIAMKKFGIDCYIIKYPEGSFIPSHTDPVDDFKHYRLNMIMKKPKQGGELFLNNKVCTKRIVFFRPDLVEHKVSKILNGSRYVFSLGIAILK